MLPNPHDLQTAIEFVRAGKGRTRLERHLGITNHKASGLLREAKKILREGNVEAAPSPSPASSLESLLLQISRQLSALSLTSPPVAPPSIPVPAPLKKRTVIFTAWEIRVKPDLAFLDCLRQMARHYDAEIYVVPIWPEDARFLPESLRDYKLACADIPLHENIFFKYVPTHALVQSPIAGWEGAIEQSVIVPGLVRDLRTLPSSHLSKQVMSTGCCGWLDASLTDYSHLENNESEKQHFSRRWAQVSNRRGGKVYAIAQQFTVPSALIVQFLDQKRFVTRYVAMPQRQNFLYDLNLKFTAGRQSPETVPVPALVMGDLHAIDREESTYTAGLEMIQQLGVQAVVLNDAFDAMSCAKFERRDAATYQYAPTLDKEAAITIACLLEIASLVPEVVYLHSNHDDHLLEFIADESNWKLNGNYKTAHQLQGYRMETGRHPIIKLLRLDDIKNLVFVGAQEDRRFGRVLIKHGHEGKAGRRVDFRVLARIYNFYVDAHGHSPGAFRNAVRVGTTSNLKPAYAIGASGWLGANGLIHADGSAQLLPIIEGKWQP